MDLPSYIRQHTVPICAERFGVSVHTINSWLYRNRTPSPQLALKIERQSEGAVTLHDIYEHAVDTSAQ